jgi:hypothetical protein
MPLKVGAREICVCLHDIDHNGSPCYDIALLRLFVENVVTSDDVGAETVRLA